MKAYSLRLWPNGEFGLGRYPIGRRPKLSPVTFTEPPSKVSWTKTELLAYVGAAIINGYDIKHFDMALCDQHKATLERGGTLGLSNAAKTHKPQKRGSSGITSYGKKMLRNGCWLLEKAAGVRSVGMFTGTIPPCNRDTEIEICNSWSEILRIFTQWLHRRLKAESPQPWVLGCTEIQEKRQAKYGGLPLHCHLVFRARMGKAYIVDKSEFCDAWRRAICCCVPSAENLNWDASTRVEQCKKSVASYLSKYMSKGVTDNVVRNLDERYQLPSTWWHGVGKFKQHLKRLLVYDTGVIATMFWQYAKPDNTAFVYAGQVIVTYQKEEYVMGVYGKVKNGLRAAVQARDQDAVLSQLETHKS